MAWIESHQGLAKHPKTLKLARKLNIHIAQAIGHLHLFWWWAMEYAQDGDLSHCDPEDIAIAADWPGDAGQFVESLVESGFVDRHNDGSLSIHDWHDYAGKLLERRKADAERKKKEREKKDIQKISDGHPTDVQRTSNVTITNNHNQYQDINTAAADARAHETTEPFPAAYRRVYQRDLTPFQAQELGAYIDRDGFEEAVVVRAIERAALSGGGIKLILHILNDYAAAGVKTLAGAISFDAEHDARKAKARGDPVNAASGQQAKIEYIRQKRKEAELREASGSLGPV